jgi:hypothetical protein
MVEIDKKLYQEIKDYCKLNDLVIKDFVNKLLKKAFTVEKYGEKPFSTNEVVSVPYIPTLEVTLEGPADLPPITNEKIIERYTKPIEGMSKENYSKFYSEIPLDESWEEKLDENIKNGSVIMAPYIVETNCPTIVVNHSKKEETSKTTDTSSSTEEKEEMKPIKKSKKRKLN